MCIGVKYNTPALTNTTYCKGKLVLKLYLLTGTLFQVKLKNDGCFQKTNNASQFDEILQRRRTGDVFNHEIKIFYVSVHTW